MGDSDAPLQRRSPSLRTNWKHSSSRRLSNLANRSSAPSPSPPVLAVYTSLIRVPAATARKPVAQAISNHQNSDREKERVGEAAERTSDVEGQERGRGGLAREGDWRVAALNVPADLGAREVDDDAVTVHCSPARAQSLTTNHLGPGIPPAATAFAGRRLALLFGLTAALCAGSALRCCRVRYRWSHAVQCRYCRVRWCLGGRGRPAGRWVGGLRCFGDQNRSWARARRRIWPDSEASRAGSFLERNRAGLDLFLFSRCRCHRLLVEDRTRNAFLSARLGGSVSV